MATSRQYDFLLLGATGHTGKLTAQYITSSLPTDIKWAIAGRSQSKLETLVNELKKSNSSRSGPDILRIDAFTPTETVELVKKTRVLINTVGPYHLYSTPIVQACAETGTHYLDVTGETPWVREIIKKYEETAKKNKAVLIPEIGLESAPSDLLAWSAVSLIRKVWDCGVMDMVASVHELKSSGASGGTLATGLGLMDHYGLKTVNECRNPFCLSPLQERDYRHNKFPYPSTYRKSLLQKLTGVWNYPMLGNLAPSITAGPNEAIVLRSAGKYPYLYGFNFTYSENMAVNSPMIGYLIAAAIALLVTVLSVPPFRALARMLVPYKPGEGPSNESSKNDRVELRGVAVAEQLAKIPRKSFVSFVWEGGMYQLTAVLIAEGAMTLLQEQDKIIKTHGYGFLTPSCLGESYVKRLDKAGVRITTRQVGEIGSK